MTAEKYPYMHKNRTYLTFPFASPLNNGNIVFQRYLMALNILEAIYKDFKYVSLNTNCSHPPMILTRIDINDIVIVTFLIFFAKERVFHENSDFL